MDSIIIKHTIEEKKITLTFDMQDGTLSFSTVELNIEGDINLNPLVIKLIELIENNRILEFEFTDTGSLLGANPKINLVKETLEEIYIEFNKIFEISSCDDVAESEDDLSIDDELPF